MRIDIRNLAKSYYLGEKEIPVLKNISLNINNGDALAITGPSGVGKSTFLHVVGTLDNPSSGSIFYDNNSLISFDDAALALFRNKFIGFVFQFHHLLSEFSAQENVMMPLLMCRSSHTKAQKQAQEMLDFVGLGHRYLHKPGELSGGEQQRVALARGLVHKPKLILADEPTGNLDHNTGQEIIKLILKYNQDNKATLLLVTHNPEITKLFSNHVVLTPQGFNQV